MIYVFLAEGFEEIEALAAVDLLRRAGLDVRTVGVGGRQITGAHAIPVVCDLTDAETDTEGLEMVVLPGGVPGMPNLDASPAVHAMLDYAVENDLWIAAICAAPSILARKGLLEGRDATAFPGYQDALRLGGARLSEAYVCVDGRYVTARGMGVALEFGLKLVELFRGTEKACELCKSLQCKG